MTHEDLCQSLEAVLDAECDALKQGHYDALDPLVERKATLMQDVLDCEDLPETALHELKSRISRNQDLIDMAMQGVRAVTQRMQDLHRARDRFETYDKNGHWQSVDSRARPQLEKKL